MSSGERTGAASVAAASRRARTTPAPAELARHLCAALDGDPGDGSLLRVALGEAARSHGMMRVSKATGLAREALYRALSERGNPELATVLRVLKALGLKVSIRASRPRRRPA